MITDVSSVEQAFRDTLITKVEDDYFTNLTKLHGLPIPSSYPDRSRRLALKAAAYGARGSLGCTHDILEGVFDHVHERFMVALDPTDPLKVSFVSHLPTDGSVPLTGFLCRHVQRLVRIRFIAKKDLESADMDLMDYYPEDLPWTDKLFWTSGPGFNGYAEDPPGTPIDWTAGTSATWLTLAPYDSGYFCGAHWDHGDIEVDPSYTQAHMTILAIRYKEPSPGPIFDDDGYSIGTYPGDRCEFQVEADAAALLSPGVYLMDPGGVDRTTYAPTPPPPGGHIMDEFNLDGTIPAPPAEGDILGDGPMPIYLDTTSGSALQELVSVLDPLLAAGVELTMIQKVFCEASP